MCVCVCVCVYLLGCMRLLKSFYIPSFLRTLKSFGMNKRLSARSENEKNPRVRTKKFPFALGLSVCAYHTNGRQLRFVNQNANGVLVQCCTVVPCSLNRYQNKQIFVFSQILESNRYSICSFPYLLPPIDDMSSAVVQSVTAVRTVPAGIPMMALLEVWAWESRLHKVPEGGLLRRVQGEVTPPFSW